MKRSSGVVLFSLLLLSEMINVSGKKSDIRFTTDENSDNPYKGCFLLGNVTYEVAAQKRAVLHAITDAISTECDGTSWPIPAICDSFFNERERLGEGFFRIDHQVVLSTSAYASKLVGTGGKNDPVHFEHPKLDECVLRYTKKYTPTNEATSHDVIDSILIGTAALLLVLSTGLCAMSSNCRSMLSGAAGTLFGSCKDLLAKLPRSGYDKLPDNTSKHKL